MPSKVFIVEDHTYLREMLEELITRTDELELCGSSNSAEAALQQLDEAAPNLMLIDLSLPGMNGLELLGKLRDRVPPVQCVVLSGYRSGEYSAQAREAGASAYVTKSEVTTLTQVLRGVINGEKHFKDYD